MNVDLVLIWIRRGSAFKGDPWSVGPVLLRDSDGHVTRHRFSGPDEFGARETDDGNFSYIWQRYLEGDGGNGYSYDYTCWAQVDPADVDRLLVELKGVNLVEIDLEDAALDRVDLSGRDLTGARLEGASLAGANMSGATLLNADFKGADLTDTNLSDADLTYCNFRFATLRNTDLRGSCLTGADYEAEQLINCLTDQQTILAMEEQVSTRDFAEVCTIIEAAAQDYWHLVNEQLEDPGTRLIFPPTREKDEGNKPITRKGSEQELRFLICHKIEKEESRELLYSVETPTKLLYKKAHGLDQQGGKNGGTAHLDLSIWQGDRSDPHLLANVEIKSGTPSSSEISWDLLKLVREDGPGVWVLALPHDLTQARFTKFRKKIVEAFHQFESGQHQAASNLINPEQDLTIVIIQCNKEIKTKPVITISVSGSDWARDGKHLCIKKLMEL